MRGTGSRDIPHRLNAAERPLYEGAKKKVICKSASVDEFLNTWLLCCAYSLSINKTLCCRGFLLSRAQLIGRSERVPLFATVSFPCMGLT